jgi:putative endonuclease
VPLKSDPSTWTDRRHKLGVEGEEIAKRFLLAAGWSIADHRFRMGRLEIDLVARRGEVVAFVEVKARIGHAFGSPLEAVRAGKRREIARVAAAWMDRHGRASDTYRFDVIGVTLLPQGRPLIEHVENAFWPGWR